MKTKKTKLKCQKCGHEWETKSKLNLVTCPSCSYKVKKPVKKIFGILRK